MIKYFKNIHNKINIVIGYFLLLIVCAFGAIFGEWKFKDKYKENFDFLKDLWTKYE